MSKRNSTFTKWALGVLAAILIALGGWVGKSIIGHDRAIAAQEVRMETLQDWMGRVERKLDRVLRHIPRDGARTSE